MAIKLAIANMKGGIGKTTTALCLANALQINGYKVLLIDTDPQRSSTGVYNAAIENTATLADMMYSDTKADECIQHLPLGDIIASDSALIDAETRIKADADRFYHLADACEPIESDYDFIICDCPPGNGVILGNVLCYCDHVIMPVTCDKFGIQGLDEFKSVMSTYTKRINPKLDILGVLNIKYKKNQTLTKDIEEEVLPDLVNILETKQFKTRIRESVKCKEAQALNMNIFDYAPSCTTAEDYFAFTAELLKSFGKKAKYSNIEKYLEYKAELANKQLKEEEK